MPNKTIYITTPIYYVNGKPHVGSALTTVCCDFLARYHRLRGEKVWFLTGTDEQATKVVEAAEKAGVPVEEFVDGLAGDFKSAWQALHIEFDDFIRTTEERHVKVVQEVFTRLLEKGDIYKDLYEGWYCVADETYFRDSDVGEDKLCPNAECRQPLRRVQQENYFFRLSAYSDRLLAHIEANPDFLQPDFRRNEVLGFIKQGLRDMSITRDGGGWGIPVPGDPNQIIYVWFDAVINYLAATGWPNDEARYQELWPADLHMVGKEIFVRFHATLWPAMLMGLGLPLPKTVYAHGWWVDASGLKSGKRTGGLPHPVDFANEIAEATGADQSIAVDALRYLLLREMGFPGDSEFTRESFFQRYNTDLANDLGNLCNRTVNMVNRYFEGVVPVANRVEDEIVALASQTVADFEQAVYEFRFNGALEAAGNLVSRMNRYLADREPWKQHKRGETDELAVTLVTCLEAIRVAAILVAPAMPFAAAELYRQNGLSAVIGAGEWDQASQWGVISAGTQLPEAVPLFPRIDPAKLAPAEESVPTKELPAVSETSTTQPPPSPLLGKEGEHGGSTGASPSQQGASPAATESVQASDQSEAPSYITIDDFLKVQLKVANVQAAERIPNADKLLKLTLEVGDETRTVLAGIAEMYEPDELVGRQVVVVANLQPRKMRGIESQGMLLAADADGQAILLQPETKVSSGTRVR